MKRMIIAAAVFLLAVTARAAEQKPYTRNVAIVVYNNAEILDFAGPTEVLSAASGFGNVTGDDAFKVYLIARTKEPVLAQGFIKVTPDYAYSEAPKADVIVVPGGNSSELTRDPAFMAWFKNAAQESEVVLTVCTGAAVLSKTGLIDGLEITTWYGAIEGLQKSNPKLTVKDGRRFIDNGKYITTAGVSAGIDGGLHLVSRLLGRRTADQVARYMEYHWTPEPYLARNYAYLNPSTSDTGRQLQLASMSRESKDFASAVTTYRAVLAKDPTNAAVWAELGGTLKATADHRGAAEAYVKAVSNAPADAPAWRRAHGLYDAAVEYAKAGDTTRSADLLRQAVDAGIKEHYPAYLDEPALAKVVIAAK
jgi:transcriptional regulator GlxA family with amidase domain